MGRSRCTTHYSAPFDDADGVVAWGDPAWEVRFCVDARVRIDENSPAVDVSIGGAEQRL
jgi:hypothetical protein